MSSIQPVPSSSSYHPTAGFQPSPPQALSTSASQSQSQLINPDVPSARPSLPPVVDPSLPDTWYLKPIPLPPFFRSLDPTRSPYVRIITQNLNGPCSFIAICNILILRGNIVIQPPDRRTVSYEFLAQLVAEWLLKRGEEEVERGGDPIDVGAALSVMPLTQKGMDLNPVFTALDRFRPSGSSSSSSSPSSPSSSSPSSDTWSGGGELKLFAQAGIQLVHGWLVDPDSPEGDAMRRIGDYDSAVSLIAEVDHLTNGRFVVEEEYDESTGLPIVGSSTGIGMGGRSSSGAGPSGSGSGSGSGGSGSRGHQWTEKDEQKVKDAIVVRRFLDTTQSQLTYHGLFQLATTLPNNSLVALFRNSHLSVLYKTSPPHSQTTPGEEEATHIYTLVTDQVFLNEPHVVWERLEDVDGGWSTFVDGEFVKSTPAGGDFAGQSPEDVVRRANAAAQRQAMREDEGFLTKEESADLALARQLQADEDRRAQAYYESFTREQDLRRQEQRLAQQGAIPAPKEKKKGGKSKDCIIM